LFSAAALRWRRTVEVHVKVDTGMGRLGVAPERTLELIEQIGQLAGLKVQGIYTHFSSVEDDAVFSRGQRKRFQKVLTELVARGIEIPHIHANNSGALLHEPETLFGLVRPGLLVYGVVPPGRRRCTSSLPKQLRPALAWKCRVSLVKEIPAGTPLSYGHTFTTMEKMRVATLTAGYGDGYLRAGSNRAHVLIGGRRCRVLGRITMDQMLVDVTRVRGVVAGDEAVLIGCQGKSEITAGELAEWGGTVPWEVLTNITYRVPRLYRGGHAA
jgi:alanine racemase